MKKMGIGNLGFLFAGCFLGAGYVSGQELLQYFGSFGKIGYLGLLIAMFLLAVFGIALLRLAQMLGEIEADKLILPWDVKALRILASLLEIIMMFAIATVMTAGVGALVEQLFGLSHVIGSAAFAVLILVIALAGLSGVVKAFATTVPILVGVTLVFGIIAAVKGISPDAGALAANHQIFPNIAISAENFACYNAFASLAILAPYGGMLKDRRTVYAGVGFGTIFLLAVAVCVLLSLFAFPQAMGSELPMLFVASSIHPIAGYVYALLLFAAMFGTGLSSFVGLITFFSIKSEIVEKNKTFASVVLAGLAFLASLIGFGNFIGKIYPLFGYSSAVFLALMLANFVKLKIGKRNRLR